ncbi:Threonine synthase [Sinobacterium norvegicum]|uniref:Threonine synthase n=1 Tax=Sinobacterium norvegicum TaxID=1641715 RepID=A0ABN8EEQ4_9GAMM|nr:threonine synthase [Sinobacterium norvegicum]CAH0990782.1 Threonine synthase [Sinobacterium norvegicum]
MRYISTRGQAPALGFEDVLLTGLAPDGGLYVPEKMPTFSQQEIAAMASMEYPELAFTIMKPFIDGAIGDEDFKRLIDESYATFRHKAVAPMVQLGKNEWVLELFHGPTLAFKDFALQLLGRLFDFVLKRKDERVVIMGATSGDTGSAAIEGCRSCKNIDIFILHPHNRVSDVQRRQMTSVLEDNVFNIAVEGNFDDCQNMVKASFADQSFLPNGRRLAAVNSINWARIMAQIVYYFWAGLSVGAPERKVAFSVPTGNFGDIFAGYLAKQMGLPISQLIIATNKNDILHRFMSQNKYETHGLEHTLSPSMDIMISSNFERALFELSGKNADKINQFMTDFAAGSASIGDDAFAKARELFDSYAVDDALTVETIRRVYEESEYLLDPHSAIGVKAARECVRDSAIPMITLATAHPAKFADAAKAAGQEDAPALPHHMADLMSREERYTVKPDDLAVIQQFIADSLK